MLGKSVLLLIAGLASLGASGASGASDSANSAVPNTTPSNWAATCKDWDEWDKTAPAYRIHGRTYYVGTCGISAILITSDKGHVLIDSGTEKGAKIVLANIRSLGFDPKDIKLLLASHEHFDHVGGMAHIQRETSAPLVFSDDGIKVMRSGIPASHDPQYAELPKMTPVKHLLFLRSGIAKNLLRDYHISPILTPGHAPGAVSYSWESCQNGACKQIVYADSLSAISAEGYRFTDHPKYVAGFRKSLSKLAAVNPCDILITPHPSASDMPARLAGENGLIGTKTCRDLSASLAERLNKRLEKESH